MKANLVSVGNAHALIPEGGYRAISAVMNEAPEVVGVKVTSNECKRLERRQVAARDLKFHDRRTSSRSTCRNLRAPCVRLAKKGGRVKSGAEVRMRSSDARSDGSLHDRRDERV